MKNSSNGKVIPLYAKLSKAERIRSKSLLLQVLKKGQKIKTSLFGLTYWFHSGGIELGAKSTLFAVSVSKKVSSKAVDRNRLKRVYRHAWQSIKFEIEQQVPSDGLLCVFISVYQNQDSFSFIVQKLKEILPKILVTLPHAKD
jgi:ribonuclease P protein component